MRINIINHLACPACRAELLLSTYKKTKERIIEGELKCKKCGKSFFIRNEIACFESCIKKRFERDTRKLRKVTLEQEIPKKWMQLYSKQELKALKEEWNWTLSVIKKDKNIIHLDFATGTGRFLRNIVSKIKGEIVALDNGYGTCLELAYFLKKINKYNNVSIVCADASKMPFKNEVFNSVSSWAGFGEPKMEGAIKEARRVLKSMAWLAASGAHYQKESRNFLLAKKHQINFITKEAIIQALKKAKFRKIEHKVFYRGKWNDRESYLPIFGDFYSTFAIRAQK